MIITILANVVIRTFSSVQAGGMNPNPFEIKKQPVLVAKRANPPAPNGNSKTTQVEGMPPVSRIQYDLNIHAS